ncbi:MAG TPA: hypothetical protein VJR05_07615 [Acidimicrobiia bacterium]|nr:hypothetical protein [Acidimicrobiia bacterium]
MVIAACVSQSPSTTTAPPSTTSLATTTSSTQPGTTSSIPATTTTGAPLELVLPVATDQMPVPWEEILFIPYGNTPETLGTSLGGDGEGIQIGPEYGAQSPDGTWWFLDGAKYRLAQFSAEGEFLMEVVLEEDLLTDGVYFQYQLPRVLDDGMLVANRLAGDQTIMLRWRGEELDTVVVDANFVPRIDDGTTLYGFAIGEEPVPMQVNVYDGTSTEAEWFQTRAGDRFRITVMPGHLQVLLPDAGAAISLPVTAGQVGGNAFFSTEVASGIDGGLYIFMVGSAENDESLQLAGYLEIYPDGSMSEMQPMRDPFTSADPGSPAHLGVRPQTNDPWLMFIDEDGVRVYGPAAP